MAALAGSFALPHYGSIAKALARLGPAAPTGAALALIRGTTKPTHRRLRELRRCPKTQCNGAHEDLIDLAGAFAGKACPRRVPGLKDGGDRAQNPGGFAGALTPSGRRKR